MIGRNKLFPHKLLKKMIHYFGKTKSTRKGRIMSTRYEGRNKVFHLMEIKMPIPQMPFFALWHSSGTSTGNGNETPSTGMGNGMILGNGDKRRRLWSPQNSLRSNTCDQFLIVVHIRGSPPNVARDICKVTAHNDY